MIAGGRSIGQDHLSHQIILIGENRMETRKNYFGLLKKIYEKDIILCSLPGVYVTCIYVRYFVFPHSLPAIIIIGQMILSNRSCPSDPLSDLPKRSIRWERGSISQRSSPSDQTIKDNPGYPSEDPSAINLILPKKKITRFS